MAVDNRGFVAGDWRKALDSREPVAEHLDKASGNREPVGTVADRQADANKGQPGELRAEDLSAAPP